MQFTRIVCLLHILSPWRAKADGFFDLVREPILQACGIDIGHAPGRMPSKLRQGFNLEQFRALAQQGCGTGAGDLWRATYHHMPDAALNYLFAHLPDGALLLSSEIPPWLRQACLDREQPFVDLHQSPLGFGRDSFIAIDTNNATLRQRLLHHAISEEELRLEAGLLGANVRIHRAQLAQSLRHVFNLDGTLIYIWQAPWDTDLFQPDGGVLHISDFAEPLKALARGRSLLFMRDFSDAHTADFLEQERATLSSLLGQPVAFCPQHIYQVLAGHDDSELVSINAAAHQEAWYFHKKSHTFAAPTTPLARDAQQTGYLQVHFQDILAPAFWHQFLTPNAPPPRIPRLPPLDRQHARETMNDWGEYEKILTWERYLPWQAYRRLGGTVTERRIEALEKSIAASPSAARPSASTVHTTAIDIQSLKNTKTGKTAYILGNGPSLNSLNISKLMALDSFWCNKAYKMEERGIDFHPKYYFLNDAIIIQQDPQKVLNINAGIKFLGPEATNLFKIMAPNACSNIATFHPIWKPGMYEGEENFSFDPASYIFDGGTIVAAAIQFAFYMGYTRILVGGVDLDYDQPYFYGSTHKQKSTSVFLNAERMKRSFMIMQNIHRQHGRLLAKMTPSPHLPLEYFEIQELLANP